MCVLYFNNTIPFISEIRYAQLSSTIFVGMWNCGKAEANFPASDWREWVHQILSFREKWGLEHVKQDTQKCGVHGLSKNVRAGNSPLLVLCQSCVWSWVRRESSQWFWDCYFERLTGWKCLFQISVPLLYSSRKILESAVLAPCASVYLGGCTHLKEKQDLVMVP